MDEPHRSLDLFLRDDLGGVIIPVEFHIVDVVCSKELEVSRVGREELNAARTVDHTAHSLTEEEVVVTGGGETTEEESAPCHVA